MSAGKPESAAPGKATPQKWAWARYLDSEGWEGEFDTIEDGEAYAHRETAGDQPLVLGYLAPTYRPDPAVCAAAVFDLDDVLERMDECAGDDGHYSGDNELFEVADTAAAKAALRSALSEWAAKYLHVTTYTVDIEKAVPVRPDSEGRA